MYKTPYENGMGNGIKGIIITCAIFYVLSIFPQINRFLIITGALKPSLVLFQGQIWRVATYSVLHGGTWHILLNMFALWMFGTEIEEIWGTKRFITFYILSAVGSGIISLLTIFTGDPLIIGASGAIYSLLVIYAYYFPDRRLLLFFIIPVSARTAVIIFIIAEILTFNNGDNISHLTHLGGILVAFIYIKVYNPLNALLNEQKVKNAEKKIRDNAKRVLEKKEYMETVIDPILKKISEDGIDSLSFKEKGILKKYKNHE